MCILFNPNFMSNGEPLDFLDAYAAMIELGDLLPIYWQDLSPEACGRALLQSNDFRSVPLAYLTQRRFRLEVIPLGAEAIHERLVWMWYAPTGPGDVASFLAEDLCLVPLETLASDLAELHEICPASVEAALIGDLDAVLDHVVSETDEGSDDREKACSVLALLFVCWAGFHLQVEGAALWQMIRNDHLKGNGHLPPPQTVKQQFSDEVAAHRLAQKLAKIVARDGYAETEGSCVDPKERRDIQKQMTALGLGNLLAMDERELATRVGVRNAVIAKKHIDHWREGGTATGEMFLRISKGIGARRGERRFSRLKAAEQIIIVAARTLEIRRLAETASTPDDLRALLDTGVPASLARRAPNEKTSDWKTLRYLTEAARVFHCEDPHQTLIRKGRRAVEIECDEIVASTQGGRKARKAVSRLLAQYPDWHFQTPFGWEFGPDMRLQFEAPVGKG